MLRPLILSVLFSTLAAGFTAAPAIAQSAGEMNRFVILNTKTRTPPPSPSKPYPLVAVKLPAAVEDAGLEAFRNELVGIANGKVYVELERLVSAKGFFWDRDFNGSFDRGQPGVDNLAAAIRLERRNGDGWATLAALAAEPTASRLTGRPGVVCAPAEPSYDDIDFDRLVDATRSSAPDWTYTRSEKTLVRVAPQTGATIIDTLGLAFVRMFGDQGKIKEPDGLRLAWTRVATPSGKIGYVAPGALTSLTPERLCYGKDGFGRWRIEGYVGGD